MSTDFGRTVKMKSKTWICIFALLSLTSIAAAGSDAQDYRILATNKTSTMEKEMNEAAALGYRFEAAMGGESAFGGSEVITVMSKPRTGSGRGRYAYKLLATNKTGTMQKELQEIGLEGFEYKDQTVFKTAYGGEEVVVILESDRESNPKRRFEYKLLATSKTSTMQKEIQQAGEAGFSFVGITVGKTAFGGKEVVTILRKQIAE
jgi:hypothetical protein